VEWDVDGLLLLDITSGASSFVHVLDSYKLKPFGDLLKFINRIATECSIPLSFVGRIRTLDDIETRILNGADKVCLNQALFDTPGLVGEAAHHFGSQAIVASFDYKVIEGMPIVHSHAGKRNTGISAMDWAAKAESEGAGEILLNAIDRDGKACGYDIDNIQDVVERVSVPVIACGGAGHQRHFQECYEKTDVQCCSRGTHFSFY